MTEQQGLTFKWLVPLLISVAGSLFMLGYYNMHEDQIRLEDRFQAHLVTTVDGMQRIAALEARVAALERERGSYTGASLAGAYTGSVIGAWP